MSFDDAPERGYRRRDLLRAGLVATPALVAAAVTGSPSSARAETPGTTFAVVDHGASRSNSGTQNAAAFQSAVDAAAAAGGGTVDFSDGRLPFDGVLTFPPLVNARGGGTIVFSPTAKWVFGNGTDRLVFRSQVSGIRFARLVGTGGSEIPDGSKFIEIDRCRELRIHDCSFAGADKAIIHKANPSTGEHDNAMIVINGNQFTDVNYAWFVDVDPAAPWGASSDSAFTDNIVNVAYITHVHCEAIDGVTVSGNVFFFVSYKSLNERRNEKKNNIYIGQSAFAQIHDNNCFEAGEEGIKLSSVGTASISGNNVAWPGQLKPSDGISVHGIGGGSNARLAITGNTVTYYTRHAISVAGDANACSVGLNGVVYAAKTPTYIGSDDLGDDDSHHRYYFDDSLSIMPIVEDGYSGRPGESDRYPQGVTGFARSGPASGSMSAANTGVAAFAAGAGPTAVFACQDLDGTAKSYSGMVMVVATSRASYKTANYVLLVNKSAGDDMPTAASVARAGDFQGASEDEPGFTWSFDGDTLMATPFRSTAGEHDFTASTFGGVAVRLP